MKVLSKLIVPKEPQDPYEPIRKANIVDAADVRVTTAAGTPANTLPETTLTNVQSWLVIARNCLAWLVDRFNANGDANSALKLATARTITVTPSATAAGNFDGSADIAPGVSVTTAAGTAANTLPGTAATNLQGWLVICRNCLSWLTARFDASGNANASLKLTTARTITITPTATAAGSFDGSANITPGVSVTTAAGTAASTLPAVTATALQTWLVTCRNCLDWAIQRCGAIPTGGTTGQVLAKTSATNFATSWQDAGDSTHANNPYAHLKVYEYMGGTLDYTPEIDKYNVMYRGNSMGVTYTFTWNNPTGTMTFGKEFVLKYSQQGSNVTHSFASYYIWPSWITKPTGGSFTAKFLVISATQCRCIG